MKFSRRELFSGIAKVASVSMVLPGAIHDLVTKSSFGARRGIEIRGMVYDAETGQPLFRTAQHQHKKRRRSRVGQWTPSAETDPIRKLTIRLRNDPDFISEA